MISLLRLYLIFTKIGAIALGGGYVILPIIENEFVTKNKLIDNDELIDFFAISQSLPGIIAANISMFVGYKLRKKRGAFVAMLGVITVPFLCIYLLSSILSMLINITFVQNIFWGVGISVIALITLTSREIWQKSEHDLFFYILFILSIILLLVCRLSPANVILFSTAVGFISQICFIKENKE